jgi:hypothetical protein
MHMWMERIAIALVLLVALGACGGKDSGGGSMANAKISAASCYKQCDAQTTVQGCTPIVGLADCKTLCDGLASSTPAACADEFDAYYNCSAKDGFVCTIGLVAQKTGACMSDQDAFDRCRNGGKKTTCQGALDSGVCPSVQCPCKSGTKPVSGFDQSGGSCKCYDAVTCMDFFCN